jgi:hypothetical protein
MHGPGAYTEDQRRTVERAGRVLAAAARVLAAFPGQSIRSYLACRAIPHARKPAFRPARPRTGSAARGRSHIASGLTAPLSNPLVRAGRRTTRTTARGYGKLRLSFPYLRMREAHSGLPIQEGKVVEPLVDPMMGHVAQNGLRYAILQGLSPWAGLGPATDVTRGLA